jgi:hypothetical protein
VDSLIYGDSVCEKKTLIIFDNVKQWSHLEQTVDFITQQKIFVSTIAV